MKEYLLECCVDSVESAVAAEKGGADRLELCANLIIGGTTPGIELYHAVRKYTNIPIHILLRPRFGDFLYSSYELEILYKEAERFTAEDADGLVIGCLTKNGELDIPVMERLIACCGTKKITLHRAFDVCKNPKQVLQQAKELGIYTILTSGQEDNCLLGMKLLEELQEIAGQEMAIMAGGGVQAKVIETFIENTSLSTFHMSGKIIIESDMVYRNEKVNMGIKGFSEYEIWRTEEENVRKAKEVLLKKVKKSKNKKRIEK